jgi:hypothetical protein
VCRGFESLLRYHLLKERAEAALVAPVRDGACVDTQGAAGAHSSASASKLSEQTHLRGSFETSNCTCAPVRRRPQLRPILARMKCPAGTTHSKYDDEMNYLSKPRNCLLHNYSKVNSKLAKARPSLREGEKLSLGMPDLNSAINALRKLAYEIDK